MENKGYRGRFAPSPTGPLHAGSLVAALASWLDAKAHGGQWLVRIEDIDTPRCVPGADAIILAQLAACGLHPDETPVYQSQRGHLYQHALDKLIAQGMAYPCGCTRQDIALALAASGQTRPRHGELIYPGTCRHGLRGRPARAWRFLTDAHAHKLPADGDILWDDRRLGPQAQNVERDVGDFILKRADGLWAYQLAVVMDDAEQAITHVVRGEDLADNTARQVLLQHALGYTQPQYLHTPLVLAADGEKLSKQNGARALVLESEEDVLSALTIAARAIGLQIQGSSVAALLYTAVAQFGNHSRNS
ncbi:MAG: tRNA glutamyl-Q(34) synthetase GluQRS [Pseudomonadota bacterium]